MKLRTSLVSAVVSLFGLIGIGTWIFHVIEEWSWAESFYFSVTTLTTVGYGDLFPTTDGSRIIASIYILIGVGIVFTALTTIGSQYLRRQEHQLSENIIRRVRNQEEKLLNRKK